MSVAERYWMGLIAGLGCLVCRRFVPTGLPAQLHHVAEGSGVRSNYGIAPLCQEHHTGRSGFHGMGSKAFCQLYRPPGDCEYGLLVWVAQDLAITLKQRKAA